MLKKKYIIIGILFILIVSILVCMFLVYKVSSSDITPLFKKGFINAAEVEKINYTNNNMTIDFIDGNVVIGKATLKSHKTYDEVLKVTSGKNKTVIWYEFSDFAEEQKNAIGDVEFIDMRETIFNYTGKEPLNESEADKYIIPNPNYLLPIEKNYTFVYLKNGKWIDYNSFDIPNKNITIGVKIDSFGWGEFLDVRINILENNLLRHALVIGTNTGFVAEAPVADPEGGSVTTIDYYWRATSDTSDATAAHISEVGWWANTATEEANFEVGLYDADENLLYVERTNAKGTTAGWKTVSVDWEIDPSTVYWIAVQLDDTATTTEMDYDANAWSSRRSASGQTTLPDPLEGTPSTSYYAIYAVWDTGGAAGNCTYVSGDYECDCTINPTISSNVVGTNISNIMTMLGEGHITINANISNFSLYHIGGGCNVTCVNGCF
jgi:hypothetical protein